MIKPACAGFFVGVRLPLFVGLFLYEQKDYLRIIFKIKIILSLLIWFQLLLFESFFISRIIILPKNRLKMAIFILLRAF